MSGIAEELAGYIVNLTFEQLPDDVADMAKKCIFDSFANMCCGRYTPMGERILDYIDVYSRTTAGEAKVSLIGGGEVSREDAMTAHAVMARCADLDDGHRYAMGHPGSVVIPAVMAAGEQMGSSAGEILTAVAAAYDIYCRVGAAINPTSYRERGFDATGIAGAPACAAAVGKLYHLTKTQMKHALGIAASFSGGLIEYQNDGTMGKVLCGCWAVRTGMEAVQLAKQGFTGPEQIFEGPKGFIQAFSNEPDASSVLSGLGQDFKIREVYFKVHACMRGLHAAVDALLSLRENEGITVESVDSIEVRTTPFVGRLSKPRPETLIGAQCSLEFVLAAALKEGHLSREEVLEEAMKQDDVWELVSRIRLTMDPEVEDYVQKNPSHWAAVKLVAHKKDGTEARAWSSLPHGEPEDPLGWDCLCEKWKRLIGKTPFEPYGEQLYRWFKSLEKQEDMRFLFAPWERKAAAYQSCSIAGTGA